MSNVYICSDTHFGHANIAKFRPQFSTAEEHDQFLFESIMNNVTKRDQLWILGDVCFTMEAFDKFIKPIAAKVQKLKIILGNHDVERTTAPTVQDYLNIDVGVHGMVKYKEVWLTHSPIHPDELRGKYNVHGHTHFHCVNDPRYLNVSMEQIGYIPQDLGQLKQMLRRRNSTNTTTEDAL
jgi:calcineurin-like phosphoesterase family protein